MSASPSLSSAHSKHRMRAASSGRSRLRLNESSDHYAMQSTVRLQHDPPGEPGIQLSQRQLDMKKQRSVSDHSVQDNSSIGRSQSARRLPQRTPALDAPIGSANERRQQPSRARSALRQKDPPSAASMVGSRFDTKSSTAATDDENEMESQRALVRSLLGGARRKSNNNPGKRREPDAAKPTKQASFKDKFRKRVFGRSKSPTNSSVGKKQSSHRSLQLLSKTASSSQHPVPQLCHTSSTDSMPDRSVADLSTNPSSSSSSPTGDKAYTSFVQDLSLEVAGAHSQLSASFRSCITGKERTVRPAPKRQLQPESVKILEQVHTRYHEIAPRAQAKQMVNDRTYRKESKGGGGKTKRSSRASVDRPPSMEGGGRSAEESTLQEHGSAETQAQATTADTPQADDQPTVATQVAVEAEAPPVVKSPQQTPGKIALMAQKFGSAVTAPKQPRTPAPSEEVALPEQQEPQEEESDGHESEVSSRGASEVPPPPPKPNLRRFDPVSRSKDMEASVAELKLTPPRLRRVAVEPKHKASPVKKSAPWANFALKPVKQRSKPETDDEPSAAPIEPEPVVISLEDMSESGLPPPPPSPVEVLPKQLGTAPEPLEMFDEDEFSGPETLAILYLKSGTSSKVVKVVLGKQCIRQIQQNPSESHGVVQWKVDRDSLEPDGMTLNMQSLTVQLLMKQGKSKALVFGSSDDCLRFATTFYNASSVPPNEVIETVSTCSSVRLDSLNDEEQSVLEKYRELRTSKGPDDAFHATVSSHKLSQIETVPTKSTENTTQSDLTADEEASVQKYRGLLQKALPLGAVKHRMALERASQKVVDVIVLEAETTDLPTTISTGVLPRSPISTFTSTSIATKSEDSKLSAGEEMTVKRYAMMLKNGVPPDAVRHKLTQDNVPIKLVSAIFSQPEASKAPMSGNSLSPDEETKVSKYKKMLKMGIPPDAVRHEMTKEAIDAKLIQNVLGEGDAKQPVKPTSSLSSADEAVVSKYRRMLKMGIPPDAVRHEMAKDQIDEKLVSAVIGDSKPESQSAPVAKSNTTKKSGLTAEEEAIAADYRKLLKRQVPRDALQLRMVKEGVSNKIIVAVLGASAARSLCDQSKSSGSASTSSNMINLHWVPIEEAPAGSFWNTQGEAPEPDRCDFAQLLERFQKKPATSKNGPVRNDASSATGKAKLLDLTRSNNIAISLKSFKEFDYTELANILAFLDPCRSIRGERSQFLRDLLPTAPEMRIISAYQGSDDRLVPAELWFCKLRGIKRLETKARVIRTMEMFTSDVSEVRGNFRMLGQVCTQVVESKKLQDVLKMVLHIGNVMNEGTRMGGASGFKFDSLLRLTQTKTADGKMTLLDYLVSLFFERNEGDALTLIVDFPELHTACRLLINDMKNEVKILSDALAECRTELKNLEKDQSNPTATKTEKKSDKASGGDPRALLFAAIASRGAGDEGAKSANFQKREQFLAAMEAKKKSGSPNTSVDVDNEAKRSGSHRIENNIAGGTTRLRNFIDSVEDSFARLESQRDEALTACRKLSTYCGEAGGISSTTTLLDVLSQFVRNIESSVKKRTEVEQRKAKAKKSQNAKDTPQVAKGVKKLPTAVGSIGAGKKKIIVAPQTARGKSFQSSGEPTKVDGNTAVKARSTDVQATPKDGKSLVLMVSDVLKQANPAFKDDFKKGRIMHDPSDNLKAIYDREQHIVLKPTPDKSCEAILLDQSGTPNSKDGDSFYSCEGDDSCLAENTIPVKVSQTVAPQPSATPNATEKPDEVRLALEEISKLAFIEDPQPGVRTSLFERARNKRQQKSSQPKEQQPEVSNKQEPATFESATARSARKKRLQMREDRAGV